MMTIGVIRASGTTMFVMFLAELEERRETKRLVLARPCSRRSHRVSIQGSQDRVYQEVIVGEGLEDI